MFYLSHFFPRLCHHGGCRSSLGCSAEILLRLLLLPIEHPDLRPQEILLGIDTIATTADDLPHVGKCVRLTPLTHQEPCPRPIGRRHGGLLLDQVAQQLLRLHETPLLLVHLRHFHTWEVGIGTGTGIIVENYGDFYASFTVGKYDFQDLKVGQKATVISLDKTYDAVVTYVSATANSTSGFDISSITSSLTGGSSSSSTNSAPVKVKIINPDEKIVLGFDVDVKIDTEKLENVVRIPVEAVTSSEGENCVFVYDPEEKTVVKRIVELGIGSDTYYEVTSGVSLGEQVVLNPKTALQDGDKIAVKS